MCTFRDAPGIITVGLLVVLAAAVVVVVVVVVEVDVAADRVDMDDAAEGDEEGVLADCCCIFPLRLRYFEIPDCRIDSLFLCGSREVVRPPPTLALVLTPTLILWLWLPTLFLLLLFECTSGIVMRSSTSS